MRLRRTTTLITLLALATGLGAVASAPAGAAPSTVDRAGAVVWTDSGPVRGVIAADHRRFQGIPYAAPPVGELRWRSPRPPATWTTPRDATQPGNRCAQLPGAGTPPSVEEDCLYLNVTTPRFARHRPVLVWLHGGGFVAGSGSEYDARRLAVTGDVVVVTINYRLGVFGIFGHPGLAGSGTFGMEDQQAALRWVKRNAAAFGGDPRRVTLVGQSAGAMAACAHLTSPRAAGLFDRLIVQSGPCALNWPVNGLWPGAPAGSPFTAVADVEAIGAEVARNNSCEDPATALACLRQVPAETLLNDEFAAALPGPAFGGRVLPLDPPVALAQGRFHKVPVLIGNNIDEGRLFAGLLWEHPITSEQYRATLDESFGPQAGRVAARYRERVYGTPALAWATVLTDRVWACTTRRTQELLAARVPTYAYEFADRDAPAFTEFPADFPPGAHHSAELAYLFEDVAGFAPELSPDQQRLSARITQYWAAFAATGRPDVRDAPSWPRYRAGARTPYTQSLAPGRGGIGPVDTGATHRCGFWAEVSGTAGTGP